MRKEKKKKKMTEKIDLHKELKLAEKRVMRRIKKRMYKLAKDKELREEMEKEICEELGITGKKDDRISRKNKETQNSQSN